MMKLAWPAIIENLSATMVILIDSAMVGSLGAQATASVAVNASPTWLLAAMVISLGVGATALVARMSGADDRQGVQDIALHTLIAGLVLSLGIMLLILIAAPWVPRLMGADPSIHQDATTYMRIVGLGALPNYMGVVSSALLRGRGDTRSPMRASLMAQLVNITGNFLLIFPTRPLHVLGLSFTMPGVGLGVRGAAIATAFSYLVSGIYLLYLVFSSRGILCLRVPAGFRPERAKFQRLARIAIPTALERMSISLGQIVFAGMVARLGTHALAAHHLSIQIESLGYMPGYGFAVAAATLVGQSLGAGQPAEARSLGLRAIRTGVWVMSTMGLIMFVFANQLISLFTPDSTVRLIGTGLIRICAFEQPFSALSIIVPGALRGAGDTATPFYIALFSMWGIRIVLAWLLGTVFNLGVQGIWVAMVLDLAVRGMLLLRRFLSNKWQHIRV
ncbi:MAG: MATE family efflux transporter [Clostridiales bacterium]|nr:MATE family efflux transporter [Clostridiales bacterium]